MSRTHHAREARAAQNDAGFPRALKHSLHGEPLAPAARFREVSPMNPVNHMNPVVKTRAGEVRGHITQGVSAFKGVPYAAPPFGVNRLRPPQPVRPWPGVRDALVYGPKTPQPPYPPPIDVLIP